MDHILVDCPNSLPIKVIWTLAKELWEMKGNMWEPIKYDKIMGCNLIHSKTKKQKQGNNRLYSIILSESSLLIWNYCCQKVFKLGEDQNHTITEIHNRWVAAINSRIKLDKIVTNKHRYGSKAVSKEKVLKTWSGVLYDEDSLPEDWTRHSEVLVGIASQRPPGRNR